MAMFRVSDTIRHTETPEDGILLDVHGGQLFCRSVHRGFAEVSHPRTCSARKRHLARMDIPMDKTNETALSYRLLVTRKRHSETVLTPSGLSTRWEWVIQAGDSKVAVLQCD